MPLINEVSSKFHEASIICQHCSTHQTTMSIFRKVLILCVAVTLMQTAQCFRFHARTNGPTSICTTMDPRRFRMTTEPQQTKFRSQFGNRVNEFYEKLKNPEARKELIVSNIKSIESIVAGVSRNIKDGESGKRGELWMAAIVGIYSMILYGVPSLLSWLIQLSAVGYTGAGIYLLGKSVWQLKENNSPYIIPSRGNQLVNTGVYEYVRHPMYGGLILTAVGLSVLSNSVEKLLLTAVLTFALVSGVPLYLLQCLCCTSSMMLCVV